MGNSNKRQATTAPSQSEIDVADAEVGGRMATMLGWRGSLQSIRFERMCGDRKNSVHYLYEDSKLRREGLEYRKKDRLM
jgi:hypothetical protein